MGNFEFKSQICTTKEQSEKLLALGLKKETADMVIFFNTPITISWAEAGPYTKDNSTPAWSLHRLMEMYGDNYNYFWFQNAYNELIHAISISIEDGSFNKDYLEDKQ